MSTCKYSFLTLNYLQILQCINLTTSFGFSMNVVFYLGEGLVDRNSSGNLPLLLLHYLI